MNTRAKKYFAINIVLLLMIASIYLATNAAMLQNVFAQVGQSPIYKGNSEGIAFLLSGQDGEKKIAEAAKLGHENGIVFSIAVTAEQLENDPEEIRAMEEMGHEIILQGMIDPKNLSNEEIRNQLHKEMGCYENTMGKQVRFYMPYRQQANGAIKNACKEQEINIVLFSQDGRAIVHKTEEEFADILMGQLKKGDFVYLDAQTVNESMLLAVQKSLQENGWKNQNISQLLID